MMNEWIVSSSILIGLVLLGRWLLRGRISLRLQYALWGVVLLRLLVPVQLFSHDLSAGTVAEQVDISAPVRWVYTEVRSSGDQDAYDEAYQQILAEYEARNQTAAPDVIDKMVYNRVQQDRELDLTRLLWGTWLTGMAVMTAVIAGCNLHFIRQLRRRRYELEISDCLLPVYVTEVVPTPCIFGFFRPAIYLTPDAAKDDAVRRHVLHHELTHYRHLDHIWSVLRSVCLVLHWYNPLVWIAAKVSRADAELACDEGALKTLGEEARGDYARTLIGLTCADRAGSVLLAATTMTGSAGSIRERIRLLMKRPKNTVLTLTAALLLVTLAVGCTFAGAPQTSQPAESTQPSEPAASEPTFGEPSAIWPITAQLAGEDVQADFSYRAKETEYMTTILFTSAEELLDIQFGELLWTEEAALRMDMRFSMPALGAEQTLAVQVPFWGSSTTYGICFTDESGSIRHFSVTLSGKDGRLILSEYVPETSSDHTPDNDMSYDGQELPIPDDLTSTELAYALPMDQAMAEYADKHPRELTEQELDAFRKAFSTLDEDGNANPAACFLLPYYDDISEMDGGEFLAYFPTNQVATEEEFDLLKAKYPDFFADWTWETMPIPIHRYSRTDIEAVIFRYSNVLWDALDDNVHYLEETGCYYNYTSDFGLGGFYAKEGFIHDDGAVIYSAFSALFLRSDPGNYTITAHLPLLAAE